MEKKEGAEPTLEDTENSDEENNINNNNADICPIIDEEINAESDGSTHDSAKKKSNKGKKGKNSIIKPKKRKMCINLAETKYEVVKSVSKKLLGWRIIKQNWLGI